MKVKKNHYIFLAAAMVLASMVSFSVSAYAENNNTESVIPGGETIGKLLTAVKDNPGQSGENPAGADSTTSSGDTASGNKEKVTVMSLLDIIKKGGIVGYLIILLSVVSLGLIIDYAVTIRKVKILPPKDIKKLDKLIREQNLDEINKLNKKRASFFAKVAIAGLNESKMGYPSMIKAMEDTGEALSSAIARKIEHLNVIGNISPMMGLLGTVIGMLRCFNEIAHVAGAIEPKQLAGGIFEALITTCMGLIVAIPSLYGYAVFKNRIDEYTGEAALAAERIVSSFKKPGKE